jgi:tartrate-resistant acid phosphatase type 5
MGIVGKKMDIDFVVNVGDNFYESGLTGVHDKAFEESFTHIYTAKSLQKPWYTGTPATHCQPHFIYCPSSLKQIQNPNLGSVFHAVLGNHDYWGDALAQHSPVLRKLDSRWVCMKNFAVNAGGHAKAKCFISKHHNSAAKSLHLYRHY